MLQYLALVALYLPFARACSPARVTGGQPRRWSLQRRREWPRFVAPLLMASTRNQGWLEDFARQGLNKHQTQLVA